MSLAHTDSQDRLWLRCLWILAAIHSALEQTYHNFEIILADDGSTDQTPVVAQNYADQVLYTWQENQGLAAARNTGVLQARGEYVAFLDSNDQWLPDILEKMVHLTFEHPDADVYFCGWRYMDADGRELTQVNNPHILPDLVYSTLLRANFLIPSGVLLHRKSALEIGLFDPTFRRLQDWEFWLRLARAGRCFISTPTPLVLYRLHSSSLSADPESGKRAALAIAEKHFGPPQDEPEDWTPAKRRAYGGAYRYCVLISVQLDNWGDCAHYMRKALHYDPSLSLDLDLFYELALGSQPLGQRSLPGELDLVASATHITELLDSVFQSPTTQGEVTPRKAYGTAYYALGLLANQYDDHQLTRQYLTRALRYRPDLWRDTQFKKITLKSIAGKPGAFMHSQLRRRTIL